MSTETVINVDEQNVKTDLSKIKKIISHRIMCRPEDEIILSKLKENLQDAINFQKSSNTNSISNDSK